MAEISCDPDFEITLNAAESFAVSEINESIEDLTSERFPTKSRDITWEEIASKLIRDKFLLTALELHAELLESGFELPKLRDYFSNPGNFEKSDIKSDFSPGLQRTASIQTFDSLDFARYSDDGDRQIDERVAVLEFELRKAKETIKSLRANLTEAAESEVVTPVSNVEHTLADDLIKSHERRPLNFLINEYLLKHNYKLTSITFADENEEQDFEDWDDVGLNVPKPPSLLLLYRDFIHQSHFVSCVDASTQMDSLADNGINSFTMCSACACERKSHQESSRENTIELSLCEGNKHMVVGDANLELSTENEEANSRDFYSPCESQADSDNENSSGVHDIVMKTNSVNYTEEYKIPDDQDYSPYDIDSSAQPHVLQSLLPEYHSNTFSKIEGRRRSISPSFHEMLLHLCHMYNTPADNRLSLEVSEIVDSSDKVVIMLARCLPHIVPNVILSKRDELIPLLLCAINLHPNAKERDKLLNILFNLIKKPDEEQRLVILRGFAAIAEHMGPTRVESELLPQCWEQITHKYTERRLLVAEACGVLIPYIPNEIRSSLVLSMLKQMLVDDKTEDIREAAVKSLAILFSYIDDFDKFLQGQELLVLALCDKSEKVVNATLQVFLPSYSIWAKSLDKLDDYLITTVISNIQDKLNLLSDIPSYPTFPPSLSDGERMAVNLINALQSLLPWLFVSILEFVPCEVKCETLSSDGSVLNFDRFPPSISPLCNIYLIMGDESRATSLINAYENYISEEWYETWEKFDWVNRSFLPSLLAILVNVGLTHQPVIHSLSYLFYWICRIFGQHFTVTKVKPIFMSYLKRSGDKLDYFNKNIVTHCIVPVYACGVLTAFNHDDNRAELVNFLQELLRALSLWHLPLESIKAAFCELRTNVLYHDILFSVLWDGVVHSSALVRCSAAKLFQLMVGSVSDVLLSTKVAPALVTLANDPDMSVRVSTVPTLGAIMESTTQKDLLAKTQMQLQIFLDDPMYKDQYSLHQEIIRTFGCIAPNCELRFRDEFILPHLVALASHNNRLTSDIRRKAIALTLLDTFSAMSCCLISEDLISELVVPGLKCLLYDIQQLAPEDTDVVVAMLHEFESKIELSKIPERRNSLLASGVSTTSMEDVRNKVSKMFTAKTPGKANIQTLFQLRKK